MLFTKNTSWILKQFYSGIGNIPRLAYVQDVISLTKKKVILSDGMHFIHSIFEADAYQSMTESFSEQSLVLKGGVLMLKKYEFIRSQRGRIQIKIGDSIYMGEGSLSGDTKDINQQIECSNAQPKRNQQNINTTAHDYFQLRFMDQNLAKETCILKQELQYDFNEKKEECQIKSTEVSSFPYSETHFSPKDLITNSFIFDIGNSVTREQDDKEEIIDTAELLNSKQDYQDFVKQICSFPSQCITSQFFRSSDSQESDLYSESRETQIENLPSNGRCMVFNLLRDTSDDKDFCMLNPNGRNFVVMSLEDNIQSNLYEYSYKNGNYSKVESRRICIQNNKSISRTGYQKSHKKAKSLKVFKKPSITISSYFKKKGIIPEKCRNNPQQISFLKKSRSRGGVGFCKTKSLDLNLPNIASISYMRKNSKGIRLQKPNKNRLGELQKLAVGSEMPRFSNADLVFRLEEDQKRKQNILKQRTTNIASCAYRNEKKYFIPVVEDLKGDQNDPIEELQTDLEDDDSSIFLQKITVSDILDDDNHAPAPDFMLYYPFINDSEPGPVSFLHY